MAAELTCDGVQRNDYADFPQFVLPEEVGAVTSMLLPSSRPAWLIVPAEQRAELVGLRSELTAARGAIEADETYSAQRLTDQQSRYEETIGELRALLTRLAPTRCPAATTQRYRRLYSE